MAPKKTNIKIKHSKFNLYNKKKSKARRALKIVVTVLVVCGLGVLGYGLGKPLLKYIQDKDQNSSQSGSATSELISSIMNSQNEESSDSSVLVSTNNPADSSSENSSDTSQPQPQITDKIYYLPDDAAASESTLTAALADAKNSGCSVVAVTLKDTIGHLLYQTDIAGVKDTEVVTGTLTASQIAAQINKEGFVPAVRINTLMDQLGSVYVKGNYRIADAQGGGSWHDNRVEKGGKVWMSPFKSEASQYIGNITDELSKAGFKHIICTNTRYPAFHSVDITTYLSDLPLSDSAKRTEALWSVVNAAKGSAESNGAEIWLEMSGTNLIAENKDCTDAELTADKEKLNTVKIAVNYDITDKLFSTSNTSDTSNTSEDVNASVDYKNAKVFAEKAHAALGGAPFAVRLPQELSGQALEDATKAFTEDGIAIL